VKKFIIAILFFFSFNIYSVEKSNINDDYIEIFQLHITDTLIIHLPLIKKPGILIKYLEANLINFSGKYQILFVDNISFKLFSATLSFVEEIDGVYMYKITIPLSANKFFVDYFYIQLDDNNAKLFIPKNLNKFIPQYAIDKTVNRINYLFDNSTQNTIAKNIEDDLKIFTSIEEKLLHQLLKKTRSDHNYLNAHYPVILNVYSEFYSTYLIIIFLILLVYYLLKRKK